MLADQEERERHMAEAVESLLRARAPANAEQCTTDTTAALVWAAVKGHADIIEQLLRARANVNQGRTKHGATALMFAASNHVLRQKRGCCQEATCIGAHP